MMWKPLDTEPPEGPDWVLLFSPAMHNDPDFPGLSVTTSNPDYARENAARNGYTHWAPVTYPLPVTTPKA